MIYLNMMKGILRPMILSSTINAFEMNATTILAANYGLLIPTFAWYVDIGSATIEP